MLYQQRKPFALCTQGGIVTCLVGGSISYCDLIDDIPDHSLSLVPFSQIREQGYVYKKEVHPIIVMHDYEEYTCTVDTYKTMTSLFVHNACTLIGSIQTSLSDDTYRSAVNKLKQEIKKGSCSNIVLSRNFNGQLKGDIHLGLLALYRQLIVGEPNAAMGYCIFDGARYIIGASPEIQLSYHNGRVDMKPISGTIAKKTSYDESNLISFLHNQKERDELFMVTDETTKIMARICDTGYKLVGPYIRDMATLIHTEYHLAGRTSKSAKEALRMSCFAPTLVGGPLQSACALIQQYESDDRGYYGGCLVRYENKHHMDSIILIRTAYVNIDGSCIIQTGATITKDSSAIGECTETHTKAESLMRLLQGGLSPTTICPINNNIANILMERNHALNPFYTQGSIGLTQTKQYHKKFLLLHNGDDFIYMLSDMLVSFDIQTDILPMESYTGYVGYDCVVIGPGPGNPQTMNIKQTITQGLVDQAKRGDIYLLGVCLGHQLIASILGYRLVQKKVCTQGRIGDIVLDKKKCLVGYYNSFGVMPTLGKNQENYFDQIIYGQDKYIDMFLGSHIATTQFHPESIISHDGKDILEYIFALWQGYTRPPKESVLQILSDVRGV